MIRSKLYEDTSEEFKQKYVDTCILYLPLPYPGVALTLADLVYKEYYAIRIGEVNVGIDIGEKTDE
jgi:hypothetical protein